MGPAPSYQTILRGDFEMAVCKLTWGQYRRWQREGKLDCSKGHRHCNRLQAQQHVREDEAIDVGRSVIVMMDSNDYNWRTVQPGLERGGGGTIRAGGIGMTTKQ